MLELVTVLLSIPALCTLVIFYRLKYFPLEAAQLSTKRESALRNFIHTLLSAAFSAFQTAYFYAVVYGACVFTAMGIFAGAMQVGQRNAVANTILLFVLIGLFMLIVGNLFSILIFTLLSPMTRHKRQRRFRSAIILTIVQVITGSFSLACVYPIIKNVPIGFPAGGNDTKRRPPLEDSY